MSSVSSGSFGGLSPSGSCPVQASTIHSTLRVCSETQGLSSLVLGRHGDNLAASKSTQVGQRHQEEMDDVVHVGGFME